MALFCLDFRTKWETSLSFRNWPQNSAGITVKSREWLMEAQCVWLSFQNELVASWVIFVLILAFSYPHIFKKSTTVKVLKKMRKNNVIGFLSNKGWEGPRYWFDEWKQYWVLKRSKISRKINKNQVYSYLYQLRDHRFIYWILEIECIQLIAISRLREVDSVFYDVLIDFETLKRLMNSFFGVLVNFGQVEEWVGLNLALCQLFMIRVIVHVELLNSCWKTVKKTVFQRGLTL